jgi:hypothetical protein
MGAKCWDQIAEGYLTPNKKGSESGDNEHDALFSSPGETLGGLFIGVVRGVGNNVRMAP